MYITPKLLDSNNYSSNFGWLSIVPWRLNWSCIYSELPLIWTPEMKSPLSWECPRVCFLVQNSPLKWGHPSNRDTLTGPVGGRIEGIHWIREVHCTCIKGNPPLRGWVGGWWYWVGVAAACVLSSLVVSNLLIGLLASFRRLNCFFFFLGVIDFGSGPNSLLTPN